MRKYEQNTAKLATRLTEFLNSVSKILKTVNLLDSLNPKAFYFLLRLWNETTK